MEKRNEFKINVGGSSIILIIVVFALAIFAVLSIKASNSDLLLAKKTRTAIKEYYAADSQAEEVLAKIDQVLLEAKKVPKLLEEKLESLPSKPLLKTSSERTGTISYEITMNDNATLHVELSYDLGEASACLYNVTTWKVNQATVGDYDFNNFQFWDGRIEEE